MRKYVVIAIAVLSTFCALIFSDQGDALAAERARRGYYGARERALEDLEEYLVEMKEFFGDKIFADTVMVGSGFTTREHRVKYEITYTDSSRTIFSYRYEGFFYTGGAHGVSPVKIGTIEVATGRKLTLDDVIPADKRIEALTRLKNAVVKKIGADNLNGEVKLIDNFCVMADGLHFIFPEYEVAAYCFGPVEVVIPAYGKYGAHCAKRKN